MPMLDKLGMVVKYSEQVLLIIFVEVVEGGGCGFLCIGFRVVPLCVLVLFLRFFIFACFTLLM